MNTIVWIFTAVFLSYCWYQIGKSAEASTWYNELIRIATESDEMTHAEKLAVLDVDPHERDHERPWYRRIF